MRDQLVTLMGAERSGRAGALSLPFGEVRDDFTRRGALGHGRFPVDLDVAAAAELEHRAERYLAILERSATLAAWVWTASNADVVLVALDSALTTDWDQIQRKERTFSAGRDVRIDALNAALERARSRIQAEVQLRVQAQERTAVPLLERLSVPR